MSIETLPVCIQLTTREDIPEVLGLVFKDRSTLLAVDEEELTSWIDKGDSLVAITRDGRLVGHHAVAAWPEGMIEGKNVFEGRTAVVAEEFRNQGVGIDLK